MKPPGNVQNIALFVLILNWCGCLLLWWCALGMLVCSLFVISLPAIESNDTECTEEGEVFDFKEKTRDKPLKASHLNLMHIWILFTYFACFIMFYYSAWFYIAIVSVAISCWLKLHEPNCYHPSRWPLWAPILYPCNSGLLISSKAFRKHLVELKTLGLRTLKESFKNAFENLGVVPTPLKCF
jgi:hypothetical protein